MNSNNNMIYIGEITFGIAIFLVVYLLCFVFDFYCFEDTVENYAFLFSK